MDQTLLNLLLHGCNLARNLESNLPQLAHHPGPLSKTCDEIIAVFLACKERLSVMEMFRAEHDQATTDHDASMGMVVAGQSSSAGENVRAVVACSSSAVGQQRPRRRQGNFSLKSYRYFKLSRRDEAERRTIRVPVPRMGNTEIPPEDGFTWRKYGQKEILGSRFPRGYFRCTHQKLYNCRAKKQVQRLDHDPDTYEVTYRAHHTCHMSATAPSVAPPPEESQSHTAAAAATSALQQQLAAPSAAGRWALEFRLGGRDHQVDFPVSDMAAAMFSSGTSSTNSMDLIFNAGDRDRSRDEKQSDDRGKGKA
ncbi:WRKY transcription factor 55 [Linum perenne]